MRKNNLTKKLMLGTMMALSLSICSCGTKTEETKTPGKNEASEVVKNVESPIDEEVKEEIQDEEIIEEEIIKEEPVAEKVLASEIINMTTEGYSSIESIKKEFQFDVTYVDDVNQNWWDGVTFKGKYALTEGGKEDDIIVSYDGEYSTYIEINGVRKDVSAGYENVSNVEIVDIDKNDRYLELALFDHGPSADYHLHIFRYIDGSIIEIGTFYANFGLSFDSILFNGEGRIIDSDHYIEFIDTKIVTEFAEVEGNVAKIYNPDYSEMLNKKYTVTRDLTVAFEEMEDLSQHPSIENIMKLEKGSQIILINEDLSKNLFYIELPDGRRGAIATQLAG